MTQQPSLSAASDIDLAGILLKVWKRKWLILLMGLVGLGLGLAALTKLEPRFRAESRLLIQSVDPILRSRSDQSAASPNPAIDAQYVADQMELLQSTDLSRKIIERLKLAKRPEFDQKPQRSRLAAGLELIGLGGPRVEPTTEQAILKAYRKRLSVYRVQGARVIVIEFWSHDPKTAAEVPNALAEAYLEIQQETKRGADPETLSRLEPEIDALRKGVVEAEQKVAEFKSTTDLLQSGTGGNIASQDFTETSGQLAQVRTALSTAKAEAAAVERAVSTGSLDAAGRVLQSGLIQNLREKQINLRGDLAALETKLLPRHPQVKGLKSQIASVSRQLEREMRKILASMRADVRKLEEREAELVSKRNVLRSQLARAERDNVQLRALEREADAQRELLNAYLIQFREASSRRDRDFVPADAVILASAQMPGEPFFPRPVPILVGGFVGGALLTAMTVLALAVLTGDLMRPAAASQSIATAPASAGQGYYHTIPDAQPAHLEPSTMQASRYGDDNPGMGYHAPPMAPEFTAPAPAASKAGGIEAEPDGVELVDAVALARSLMSKPSVRLVVLCAPNEKRNGGAVLMARTLSAIGRTVLVDLSGDSISTALMCGRSDFPGFYNVLAGEKPLGEVLRQDVSSAAHVVPTGRSNVALGPGSSRIMTSILDALKQTHRFVMVDAPTSTPKSLSRLADAQTKVLIGTTGADISSDTALQEEIAAEGFGEVFLLDMRARMAQGQQPA